RTLHVMLGQRCHITVDQQRLSRVGRPTKTLIVRDIYSRYGHMHNGKQNHHCKDCGRQCVACCEYSLISDDTRALSVRLLVKRIALYGWSALLTALHAGASNTSLCRTCGVIWTPLYETLVCAAAQPVLIVHGRRRCFKAVDS